jgi:hypothetical protein
VIGAAAIVVILVLVIPVLVLMSCAALAAVLGWLLKTEVDERYQGTEYLELAG